MERKELLSKKIAQFIAEVGNPDKLTPEQGKILYAFTRDMKKEESQKPSLLRIINDRADASNDFLPAKIQIRYSYSFVERSAELIFCLQRYNNFNSQLLKKLIL